MSINGLLFQSMSDLVVWHFPTLSARLHSQFSLQTLHSGRMDVGLEVHSHSQRLQHLSLSNMYCTMPLFSSKLNRKTVHKIGQAIIVLTLCRSEFYLVYFSCLAIFWYIILYYIICHGRIIMLGCLPEPLCRGHQCHAKTSYV